MPTEDTNRLRRLRQGEAQDFETLYDLHADRLYRLYRLCLRLCGRAADAEDLTQEAFVAAFQGRERFEGRASAATWLFRIALYRWRQRCASDRLRPAPLDGQEERLAGEDPTQARLDRMELEAALSSLPNDLREAFLLVKSEGFKYREAAEILGVPQGTVQYRVHEAAARPRALMRPEDESPRHPTPDAQRPLQESADAL